MSRNLRGVILFPRWHTQWHKPRYLFVMLAIIYVVSACNSASSKQYYEDSDFGISLEKPRNWSAKSDERTRSIVLEADTGLWNKDSSRITIMGIAISPLPYLPEQELLANVERLRTLYNMESITLVQEPIQVESDKYEIATATILIPTEEIPADSTGNQVGVQESDTFQTVELYAIRCIDNFAMVYVYKGNNEQLNAEAEDIVKSIELNCSTEP